MPKLELITKITEYLANESKLQLSINLLDILRSSPNIESADVDHIIQKLNWRRKAIYFFQNATEREFDKLSEEFYSLLDDDFKPPEAAKLEDLIGAWSDFKHECEKVLGEKIVEKSQTPEKFRHNTRTRVKVDSKTFKTTAGEAFKPKYNDLVILKKRFETEFSFLKNSHNYYQVIKQFVEDDQPLDLERKNLTKKLDAAKEKDRQAKAERSSC
eukprot:snap_masked-scaffold_12-processed-gene-9.29-mRNA-1 protein AED:1.00 eAED:1.00 QI:0/0/0/0/1/1/3/0/213